MCAHLPAATSGSSTRISLTMSGSGDSTTGSGALMKPSHSASSQASPGPPAAPSSTLTSCSRSPHPS